MVKYSLETDLAYYFPSSGLISLLVEGHELIDYIPGASGDTDLAESMVLNHELTHWYSCLGTTTGQHLTRIECAQGLVASKAFECAKNEIGYIPKPLYPWWIDHWANRHTFPETSRSVLAWHLLEEYRILFGDKPVSVQNAVKGIIPEAQIWLLLGEKSGAPKFEELKSYWTRQVECLRSTEDYPSAPFLNVDEPLSWPRILEGWARTIEVLSGTDWAFLLEKPRQDIMRSFEGEYGTALKYYLRETGQSLETGLVVLLPFLLLLDIAANSPLDPLYIEYWKNGWDWRDFDPGWRFAKTVKKLAELRFDFATLGLKVLIGLLEKDSVTVDKESQSFISTVCDLCRWPTPINLALRRNEFVGSEGTGNRMDYKIHRKAMHTRSLSPSLFALGPLHPAKDILITEIGLPLGTRNSMPGYLIGWDRPPLEVIKEGAPPAVFLLGHGLMYALCREVMYEVGPLHDQPPAGQPPAVLPQAREGYLYWRDNHLKLLLNTDPKDIKPVV